MNILKRLRVLPVLLGLAASLVAVGTNLLGVGAPPTSVAPAAEARPDGARFIDELAVNKFSKMPVLTYQPRDGEMLFAWQIQPTVAAPAPRPRDVLVLVDTTASQAGRPLQQARQIVAGLGASLGADDRVSVWSLSTPASTRAVTKDFQAANSADVQEAARSLTEVEYGAGAADLKGGLEKALATLAPNRGRHQIVLYLGDGESAYTEVTEADRLALGNKMDLADQYFFAVPLGVKLDAHNLHGLAVLTGGSVVRVQEDLAAPVKRAEFITRLKAALDVPVVKPEKWAFGAEVGESYPTKLPPLRADRTTLVMGKLAKADATAVSATVHGLVNGRAVELKLTQPLPVPQVDHYFLNLMLHQWRGAPHKDAPAMLQADRVLALASTQVKLYRNEFLTQAVWAISVDRLDEAEKLYAAALKVDPTDKEALSGSALVGKMRAGKLTKAQLAEQVKRKTGATKVEAGGLREFVQDPGAVVDPPAPGAGGAPAVGPGGAPLPGATDPVREAAARRLIEEQRYKVLVDATVRRARQLLRADPDAAYQDLKRQRDDILAYDGLGESARRQLVADLESVMREVFVKGAEIKRQADAERAAIARTRQRLNEFDRAQDELARDKNRIDQFRQLMQQARYELAYQEAQLMIQEKVNRGLPVPPQATASYIIGQHATQLREWKELVRIREDRFLLTMMQTEKSHIPYPDEPPVHFPPAAVWRELTGLRKAAYENSNLGLNPTETQKQLKSVIEGTEVQLKEGANINEIPLFELLQDLSKRYQVTFIVMEEFFKADGIPNIREEKAKLAATQLRGLKLGAFLDVVLLSMNATYIVRPDYIEITTFRQRLEEKVTRVFPVADLAIPIPSAVNQQQLFQNLFFQNQTLAIFGQASFGGQQNFLGGIGGGNVGNIGGNNPLNAGGNPGPFGNNGGVGGQQPGGFGGGFTSFGGGQLGQFGNLGGQFGLQGGDQSGLLIQLIVETVAKGEWDPRTLTLAGAMPMPGAMDDTPIAPKEQQNSMGYYPPARALIVRGTNRYHPATSIKFPKDKIGGAVGAIGAPRPDGGAIVIGPAGPPQAAPMPKDPAAPRPKDPVAAAPAADPAAPAVAANRPTITDPKLDAVALRKRVGNDPKTMWNNAIDWTVTDPGLIVACAEFLMEFDEPGAAVEVLKGNLRKGLATEAWAHEALAVALQAARNSAPAEVERAAVSGVDLDPNSAKAFLKAAKAQAALKNHDQAMAFCKRAAACSPNDPAPYANALAYAEFATDVRSDAVMWAANGLLKRDWSTTDGIDYHAQAKARLPKLETKLKAAGQNTAAVSAAITEQTQRDLVIELLWQGNADLDLTVVEPTGSAASATQRRTTGGGVLKADVLEQQNDRSEVYTAASAFNGTYRVTVKQAFGRPIGGTAQVKVTKFKGTPKETTDLIAVQLSDPRPIDVRLDGGSRTTLAEVYEEAAALDLRAEATGATLTTGASGLGGGVGTAGSALSSPVTSSNGPALPVVVPPTEVRMPGVAPGAADIRASYKLNPDRKTYSVTVNPVFTGKGEVAMPKVPLLPGGER